MLLGLLLEQALEGIQPQATGEGAQPDSSGSATPLATPPADGEGEDKPVGDKDQIGDGKQGEEGTSTEGEKTQEQILEELKQAAAPQENDTPTIKSLRELLKTRVDKFEQPGQAPALSDNERETLEMAQGLFGYDVEKNQPTTVGFINKLAEKDSSLVGVVLRDAINVPVPNAEIQGWTYGHELLQSMGLDPMKFNELVQFSRGEISGEAYGIQEVPDYVPAEYQDAYKQLNPVNRTDVDIYLRSDDPNQKAAGLQQLQDKRQTLELLQQQRARTEQETASFNQVVNQEVETQLATTYSGLLDSVGKNPAFATVTVHSDPKVDLMVKDTIVNQICALADDNAVLAKRAVESFKRMEIEIDVPKVQGLLQSIKTETEIAVRAERQARAQGKTHSVQAQEALARRSTVVGQAIALANKYAGDALAKYSPPGKGEVPNGGEPIIKDRDQPGNRNSEGRPANVKSEAELDQLIQNVAKGLREGAQAT